jgi:hypothetical protein
MVMISCAPSVSNEAIAVGDSPNPIGSSSVTEPERDQARLESFVHGTAGSSDLSTPSGVAATGDAMDMVSATTSSGSFDAVMGVMQRFVKIGDAIAKVSISRIVKAILHSHRDLMAGSPICETCVDGTDCCSKGLHCLM